MSHYMGDVTITMNGFRLTGREGMTILEVAQANGIDVPTLCHRPELTPIGACRICVVEVEGSRTLVGACHTPITEGMVIQTHSPKVLATRRVIVELLLASHCGTCFMCDKANICELRSIAADLDIGLPRFQLRRRYYPKEDVSPYKQNVFAVGYRGFDSKIVFNFDHPIDAEVCRDCDVCISFCPTGALSKPGKISEEKKGKPLIIRG